jgi:diguanylate cyclase (GGDEF)-like protein
MIHEVRRLITSLAGPLAIMSVAFTLLPRLGLLSSPWEELLPQLPLPIIAAGLLLSFQFRRGRVFLALLLLAALYCTARADLFFPDYLTSAQQAFNLLSLLIPFNMALFLFMRERGVLTLGGRMRLGFILAQAVAVAWLIRSHGIPVARFLGTTIFQGPLPMGFSLPHPVFLVLAPSMAIATIRLPFRLSPVNAALYWALAAAALVSCRPGPPHLPALFVAAAALALILGVLQDSHDMAFRDELTGLPSRRALNERLTDMGKRYVIAMLDVDYFKGFNDTYGHDVGDQVLKMVARKIQGVKGGGKAYRYGGEEFTVIFPRGRMDDAIPHLEELRKSIAEYRLVLRDSSRPEEPRIGKRLRGSGEGETVSVTISIGVAESGDHSIPAEVLKEADQALYRAKRKGRNILSK